jgi:SAM-dependent methyltransferase
MHEILTALTSGAKVLDLGSGPGSFDATQLPLRIFRADIVPPTEGTGHFVACSAAELPFANGCFQAVILNHSLEHFENLAASVAEIARVLAKDGYLYVAVPDASTFTDRVYRWLGRGGGHVNPFTDAAAVARMFTEATGLRHAGTRVLCTSLSFLNRRNIPLRPPRKLLLFANGNETFVRWLTYALRRIDGWFHWCASVYGWAFFFGGPLVLDLATWSNVCVRCGSGSPSSRLQVMRRRFLPDVYRCPNCGTRNLFTDDRSGPGGRDSINGQTREPPERRLQP